MRLRYRCGDPAAESSPDINMAIEVGQDRGAESYGDNHR